MSNNLASLDTAALRLRAFVSVGLGRYGGPVCAYGLLVADLCDWFDEVSLMDPSLRPPPGVTPGPWGRVVSDKSDKGPGDIRSRSTTHSTMTTDDPV